MRTLVGPPEPDPRTVLTVTSTSATPAVVWHQSSFCGSTNCVEVAVGGTVRVRDAVGSVLEVDPAAWRAFLRHITRPA